MKIDRRGVIGMPVRLAVIFLIISISLPFVLDAAEDGEARIAGDALGAEADIVCAAAASVYYSGIGSSKAVEITIGDGCEIGFDDPYAISLSYKGSDCGKRYVDRPALQLVSDGLVLGSGTYTVNVTSIAADRPTVEVSLA